jgi:hypothetical protein
MTTENVDIALQAAIQGYPDIAEDLLRKKLEDQPDDLRIIFNLGWHDMRHGKLRQGFNGMNAGRFLNVFGSPALPGQIWSGEDLHGKTLLFRSEGGHGDEIMNVRFARDFEELGAKVIVSCHPSLMGFFADNGFTPVSNGAAEAGGVYYDYWVPGMSAGYAIGYEYEDMIGKAYLDAPKRDMYERPGTLKVGVKWSGNPQFEHEQHRKFDPTPLIDLHQLPGTTFYSLQRDHDLMEFLPFGDLKDQLTDWRQTASILKSLDLVITSCTSVAHCAAALGVETWVLVPILPYYCWALPGSTSPWYDSARLFRQTQYGNWDEPMANIKKALEDRLQLKIAA